MHLGRTTDALSRTIPDYVMIIDDHTGLIRIMMDFAGLRAHAGRHIAAKGRMLPGRHARRIICVKIGRRGRVGHQDESDIAVPVHPAKGFAPAALMPSGNAQQIPDQPWPEQRQDKVEIGAKGWVHARNDAAVANLLD